jgi:hypothetical protein
MILILSNGTRIKVHPNVAKSIAKSLMEGDAKQWQCHFDGADQTILDIINLKEVAAICREEDIV